MRLLYGVNIILVDSDRFNEYLTLNFILGCLNKFRGVTVLMTVKLSNVSPLQLEQL